MGVDVEVVCLPLLCVDVTVISVTQHCFFSDLFQYKTTYDIPSSVGSGVVVILIDSIVPVVEEIIVDIIKPSRADVQRRREVGVQTSEPHRSWLLT